MTVRIAVIGAAVLAALAAASLWWWQQAHRITALQVPVAGGDGGGLALADPDYEHVDGAALERASRDPVAAGLAAFIVMRHGHVIFERFGAGMHADTEIDSGPFAQGLVALLGGIAFQEGKVSGAQLSEFDPARWRAAIEHGTGESYADYLSHKLWVRLNAPPAWIELPAPGAAVPADCCFHARVLDWMRVAGLLIDDGSFEGTRVLRRGWVAHMRQSVSADGRRGLGIELAAAAHGAAPFDASDSFFLRGRARWRLWLVPSLHLAVLFGAEEQVPQRQSPQTSPLSAPAASPGESWDETRLPNLVIDAVTDRTASQRSESLLQQLVPHH